MGLSQRSKMQDFNEDLQRQEIALDFGIYGNLPFSYRRPYPPDKREEWIAGSKFAWLMSIFDLEVLRAQD
jgi:hypothetical protein